MKKSLFKSEKQSDIFKVILASLFYLFVFFIFKAGIDFQKLVPFKSYVKPEKNITYRYSLSVNGSEKSLEFNEKKTVDQILDSYFEKNIQFVNYNEGTSIEKIYASTNIAILINGEKIDTQKLPNLTLDNNTKIEVNY